MKKYILIQNDGEIETNSFELIGASTKRGETGKIGFFGSGLKYSIAYMMRNGIEFKVFSGTKELIFTTKPEQLKEQTFDRICINGVSTSYTVTMGPTWTEDWFVLREIYCNAMDECNCQLVKETENINPTEGKTRIYIALTEKLAAVVDNWDKYFSIDREPLFTEEKVCTSYLSSGDINGVGTQAVTVFSREGGIIYRKGIRVAQKDKLLFDYLFDSVEINEDRTAKHADAISYATSGLLAAMTSEDYVKAILRTGNDDKACYEYNGIGACATSQLKFSTKWIEFSKQNLLVIKEISGRYADEISKSKKEALLIPAFFARELKKQVPETIILGMGRALGDVGMMDVDVTPKMNLLLKEVCASLKEMGYDMPYDITIVQFDDENTLGQADIEKKQIYLSDRVFDMGRREIALTLMEEVEHIYSQKGDETRAFQTHLLSSWLKTMENSHGLFL